MAQTSVNDLLVEYKEIKEQLEEWGYDQNTGEQLEDLIIDLFNLLGVSVGNENKKEIQN